MEPLNRAIKIAGGVTALGRLINVRQTAVSNWKMRGNVPAQYCADIEKATAGKVTRKHFYPKDWARIWPELAK